MMIFSLVSVGRYGDRSPRSIPARIFSIIWTLTGLVIIGILVGAVASSLTSVTVDHSIILYGAKVCLKLQPCKSEIKASLGGT